MCLSELAMQDTWLHFTSIPNSKSKGGERGAVMEGGEWKDQGWDCC